MRGLTVTGLSPEEELVEETRVEMALAEYGPGVFLLVGEDGNSHAIVARVNAALRDAGWPKDDLLALRRRMLRGDYHNLLRIAMMVQHPTAYELECAKSDLEEDVAAAWEQRVEEQRCAAEG